jgi:ABC-type phosphate transport system permease subunit
VLFLFIMLINAALNLLLSAAARRADMRLKSLSNDEKHTIHDEAVMWFTRGYLCADIVLILYICIRGPNISWHLLSTSPSYLSDSIGILPDILSTCISSSRLCHRSAARVGAAIYLTEYAGKPAGGRYRIRRETLSGIPSIIYGLVGMLLFCEFFSLKPRLWPGR